MSLHISSSFTRRWFLIGLAVVVIVFGHRFIKSPQSITRGKDQPSPNEPLHLVVLATSGNKYLCQLLLSATILGYPTPTLINWGRHEEQDEYVQHLTKVQGILDYLNSLPESQNDDLCLAADGYDLWFLLPPDLLILRYHEVVAKSPQKYDAPTQFTDTVIFGQDKICWPGSMSRTACWAVPDSTLPSTSFGPDTDRGMPEHNRPRWLNSGTIMGKVKHLREVFEATLNKIHTKHTENSDQFYFANLFADQSYVRGPSKDQVWPNGSLDTGELLEYPDLSAGQRTEYGIGIDYESDLFQTVAYYEDSISFAHFTNNSVSSSASQSALEAVFDHTVGYDARDISLPLDLLSATPSEILFKSSGPPPEKTKEKLQSWSQIPIGLNTATNKVFPILHFTGKKGYREIWWRKTWFYGLSQDIMQHKQEMLASKSGEHGRENEADIMIGVGGVKTLSESEPIVSWDRLCGIHEDFLFGKRQPA